MTSQNTFDYVAPPPEEKADTCPQHENAAPAADPAPAPAGGTTAVTVIEIKQENMLAAFTTEKGLDPYLEELARRARASIVGSDVTTIAGQDIIRSVAYSLAKSKKPLETMADALTQAAKATIWKVNEERDRGIAAIDELQTELRRPLTEYEAREKTRIKAHKDRLLEIAGLATFPAGLPVTCEEIQARIDRLGSFKDVQWQEFTESARAAMENFTKTMTDMLENTKKAEAAAAELAQLRAAEAARLQKEHDDRIAREAAEKARIDAEMKAAIEKKQAEEAAAAVLKAETEAKEKAEREKKEAEERAAAAAEKAKADAKAAEDKRLADLKAAEEKAEREKAAAVQAEKDRVAAEKKKQDDADAARAANEKHKAKINGEALRFIMTTITACQTGAGAEEIAKAIVIAIAKGEIPSVTIKY